jgi:hypothetical protein
MQNKDTNLVIAFIISSICGDVTFIKNIINEIKITKKWYIKFTVFIFYFLKYYLITVIGI